MSNVQYVLSVMSLSFIGIVFSYINSRIVICPRNIRRNRMLDIGFILMFLMSLGISMFGFHLDYMRHGMLVFLVFAVLYVVNNTLDHYISHDRKRRHYCQHRAYTNGLKGILGERYSGSDKLHN